MRVESDNQPNLNWCLWFKTVIFVVIIWIGISSMFWWISCWNHELAAQIGDSFGSVNALFSALAFAGVIVAVFLQKKELQLQREELASTREELKGQKEQMRIQNFDSTFFQLMNFLSSIADATTYTAVDKDNLIHHTGRKSFEEYYHDLLRRLKSPPTNLGDYEAEDHVKHHYNSFYQEHKSILGRYFDQIRNTIVFIESSQTESEQFYAGLLESQLSTYEKMLLFYHAFCDQKFKQLIEKFGLLRSVSKEELWELDRFNPYDEQAFGQE